MGFYRRRFAVIGSTGSHYNVELKDPAPSCQCVDYRIRKRICKHQKLVLLQLGIPDAPQDWYKVCTCAIQPCGRSKRNRCVMDMCISLTGSCSTVMTGMCRPSDSPLDNCYRTVARKVLSNNSLLCSATHRVTASSCLSCLHPGLGHFC